MRLLPKKLLLVVVKAITLANLFLGAQLSHAEHNDLLFLTHDVKQLLDQNINRSALTTQRVNQLLDFLYQADRLNIRYSSHKTLSALETFEQKSGNCLSLANLFIASARYLDIEARYQYVHVAPQWRPQGEFLSVPSHMNVVVKVGPHWNTIEFDRSFFDENRNRKLIAQHISDERAAAEFYNNLGAEKLALSDYKNAIYYFDRAIALDNSVDNAWSNRGVAFKQLSQFKNAELSYQKALAINPKNNSAVKNLHILYQSLGDERKKKKYEKRVEKYARKNPYYLNTLAVNHIRDHQYKKAIKLLKKSIKIYDGEALFFHNLAIAYTAIGKHEMSTKSLIVAHTLASPEQKAQFQNKLSAKIQASR